MIKPTKGVCIDCGPGSTPKYLIAGRCQQHYWPYRSSIKQTKEVYENIPNEASKNDVCCGFASTKTLGEWYNHHISSIKWECENCKKRIIPSATWAKYSVQAHILPKEHFPTLSLLLDNHLVLGVEDCGCHDLYDLSWENAKTMAVFPRAKSKISPYISLLTAKEMRRLPEIFTTELTKPL